MSCSPTQKDISGLKKQCDQLTDEKWNIPYHISKQRKSQPSAVVASTDWELVSPEGTQEGKNTCHLAAIKLQPLPIVSHQGNSEHEKPR